ncbi:hypothetical protein EUX98_g6666 [Antrodiella citrinella]|uniref:Uncharacterized protein n=1 Tax=Antrodiella citrinella TaxID=2447956 RepID=A0A4S4MNQ0_9APHY|nr:hypothetical protein EUX98_g6666 [Antrodiella citrinella]
MSTTIEHEVITIIPRDKKESWEALRQQCWDLRIKVYIHEQGFPLGDEFDNPRNEVATIRCIKFDGYYKLGCLVVLKERRQLKLGQKLAEALHSYVKEEARQALVTQGEDYTDKTVRIIAYSQVQAKAFYAK